MIKNFFFRNKSESESIAVLKMVNPEFKDSEYTDYGDLWLYIGYYNGEIKFSDTPDEKENCIVFEHIPSKKDLQDFGIIEKKKTFVDLKVGDTVYQVRINGDIVFSKIVELDAKEETYSVLKTSNNAYKCFWNKSDAIAEQHRILQSIYDEKLREFKEQNKDLVEILDIEI